MSSGWEPRCRGPQGEIAVIGLARSGRAAAMLLRQHGGEVYASDAAASPETGAVRQRSFARRASPSRSGGTTSTGSPDASARRREPGRAADRPAAGARAEAGVPHRQRDRDRAPLSARTARSSRSPAPTARRRRPRSSRTCCGGSADDAVDAGNIGTPLSEIALRETAADWIALEMSSFQLHDTPSLQPDGRSADESQPGPSRSVRERRRVLRRQGAALPNAESELALGRERGRQAVRRRWLRGVAGHKCPVLGAAVQPTRSTIARTNRLVRARRAAPRARRASAARRSQRRERAGGRSLSP